MTSRHFERKRLGLCTRCGREKDIDGLRCSICTEKYKIADRERRQNLVTNRKQKYLCVDCGNKCVGCRCKDCRIRNNNYRKSKTYRQKDRVRQKFREESDLNFKLKRRLRTRLRQAILQNYKSGSAISDLGCPISKLKSQLESQFQEGMSWDNYGEWHIDHIKPLAKFDLTDRTQFLEACHYTNLQPLWAKDNLRKSCKV